MAVLYVDLKRRSVTASQADCTKIATNLRATFTALKTGTILYKTGTVACSGRDLSVNGTHPAVESRRNADVTRIELRRECRGIVDESPELQCKQRGLKGKVDVRINSINQDDQMSLEQI